MTFIRNITITLFISAKLIKNNKFTIKLIVLLLLVLFRALVKNDRDDVT